jgi:hypothetical protein
VHCARTTTGAVAFAALLIGIAVTPAHGQTEGKNVQQLEKELAARDAEISDLQRRVQALEERLGPKDRTDSSPPPVAARPQAPRAASDRPKDETLDEDSRALERALVRSGGLLLGRGQFEFEPGLQYDYNRRTGLGLVPGGIASRDVQRDNYVANATLRGGLPWNAQFEIAVPFGYQKIESVTAGVSQSADDTGIGDIQVRVLKQLLNESSGRPGLIGSVAYQRATGDSGIGLIANPTLVPTPSLGVGYDSWSATLTAVKRMDPLVFLGSLTHSFNQSTNFGAASIEPADTNSGSFRAILAASPGISLRTGFSLARTGDTKLNGLAIPGSKQTVGFLELGGSMVMSRRVLLDLSLGVGLTDDSPDFVIGASLPIRF